jgi:ABC-type nitrate/sulfonate/bicarbonate transport system permease component
LAASLRRVFIGFSLGAAAAIPLGMLLGLSTGRHNYAAS